MSNRDSTELPLRIFIVEDDAWYGEWLAHHLSQNPDNEVSRFASGKECLREMHQQPQVVTIDYRLPDMTGQELMEKVKAANPSAYVVFISGQEDIRTAINMLRKGAYEYLVKDNETSERLWNSIGHIRQQIGLSRKIENLQSLVSKRFAPGSGIIGNCKAMRKVFELMEKAAATNITVSIYGETGTGKELAARAIHFQSKRADKPFVAVNLSAIPRDLIESELFGHEKGAFTGAVSRRIGRFEEANQGTLFLDEIAELDISLQAKLLRVLQEKEISRVGSNSMIPVDVRIITATHRNLSDMVHKGEFREDLYYRLLGLPLVMPPLSDREEDIIILANHFLDEFCRNNGIPPKTLTPAARRKLLEYSFPGNVRELKAIIDLAAVVSAEAEIDEKDITFTRLNTRRDFLDQDLTLEEFQNKIIQHFMERNQGNVLEVARRLNVGKSTLYRLIKEGKIQ